MCYVKGLNFYPFAKCIASVSSIDVQVQLSDIMDYNFRLENYATTE